MALITLVKTDEQDPAIVGEPFFYNLRITNLGPDTAMSITLTDQLPATVAFLSATVPCTLGPGNVLTCLLGDIPVGATLPVGIEVAPLQPGTITNVAIAAGANTNTVQDVETTQVLQTVEISVKKRGDPDPVFVGGILTYTISVFNFGPAPAVDVVLTDDLPGTVELVSSSVPCTLNVVTNQLTCNLGTIPIINEAVVMIQVRPGVEGNFLNTATAAGTNTNTASATISTQVILAADLAVTKTVSPKAQVNQGLTYTVTVVNNGPATATVSGDEFDPDLANNTATATTTVFQCCPGLC
jgi:uncharacterized repeat protein (TIGR01451 family)